MKTLRRKDWCILELVVGNRNKQKKKTMDVAKCGGKKCKQDKNKQTSKNNNNQVVLKKPAYISFMFFCQR